MDGEPALQFLSLEFACYDRWQYRPISQVDDMTRALIGVEDEANQ